jgi:hypothetical protein
MTDTLMTIETVPMPIGPFFRFPDEATWTEAATEAGFFSEPDEDGNTTLAWPTPMTVRLTWLASSPVEVSTTLRLAT